MRHVKHLLAVVVPVLVAGASSLAVSPAARAFTVHHPGDVAYIVALAGVLRAGYKAYQGTQEPISGDPTAGPGSASMGAK